MATILRFPSLLDCDDCDTPPAAELGSPAEPLPEPVLVRRRREVLPSQALVSDGWSDWGFLVATILIGLVTIAVMTWPAWGPRMVGG